VFGGPEPGIAVLLIRKGVDGGEKQVKAEVKLDKIHVEEATDGEAFGKGGQDGGAGVRGKGGGRRGGGGHGRRVMGKRGNQKWKKTG